MGQGSHLALWGLLCAALACTQTARAAAAEYCPVASPYLECVWNAGWRMPNLTTVLVGKKQAPLINIPPLQLDNVPGKPNLLGILPLNGAVDLVYRSVPVTLHQCAVPILRTSRVNSWAGNSNSKYYPLFKSCKNAPWTDAPENSFIMGAFGDLSKLTAAQLRTSRALGQFRNRYGRYMPNLGLCVGNNPCGMNIFVGLENVDQYASMRFNLGYGRLNVTVKPSSYYYSWGVSVSPPAWRPAAPPAWGIDPQTLGTIGYTSPVTKLSGTSYTGSVYVEGPLTGGRAANVLTTPDVVFSISSQARWWGMLRDLNRRAVSMGLALAPDLLLWNRVSIPLRSLRVGGSVKLTTRTADSFFWLGAPGQQLPAYQLAAAIPQVGNLMALLYKNAKTGTSFTISGVDVHGHGNGGVGLRLWFEAGAFTLQPGPRSVVGVPTIFTDFGAIFRINKGSPNWDRSVTVDLGGKAHQVIFCQFKVECPGACYRTCDTKLRVCVPRLPPPSGCLGTTPVGYVNPDAASVAASAAVEEEVQPELPPGSPAPLGDRVEAASAGRQCSWDRPCPRGQRCESDYERERYVCVP